MVNNEVQLGVEPGRFVDVAHIELGKGERFDGWSFMEVHILHAQFNTLLIEREDHGIVSTPAAGSAAPFGGVPFEAEDATVLDLALHLLHGVGHTRVNSAQGDDALGGASTHGSVAVGVGKAGVVEVHQHLGGEDGHVGIALDKHLVEIPVGVDLAELPLVVHRPLFVGWVEAIVECIEGLDEGVAKAVLAVFLASIPEAGVCIEYK